MQTGKYWALKRSLIIQKKTRKWFKYQLLSRNQKLSEEKHMTSLPVIPSHGSHYLAWVPLGVGRIKEAFFWPVFLQIVLCLSNMVSHWFRTEDVCGHICLLLEAGRHENTDYSRIRGYLSILRRRFQKQVEMNVSDSRLLYTRTLPEQTPGSNNTGSLETQSAPKGLLPRANSFCISGTQSHGDSFLTSKHFHIYYK